MRSLPRQKLRKGREMHAATEKSGNSLRLILIDDLPLRRAGVKSLLGAWAREDDLRLEVVDLETTARAPADAGAHLVTFNIGGTSLADLRLRERIDGLRQDLPGVPMVIISDNDDAGEVVEGLRAGASGFICARTSPSVVFQVLRFIMSGGVYFPSNALLQARDAALDAEWNRPEGEDGGSCEGLTARQNAVLQLLQKGYSNKHIARELSMCESTVKVHVRQIMRKLGASNRTQAALCGIEQREGTEVRRSTSSLAAEPGASPLGL